tara:strand:+ start:110 stop:1228 length:1119 start_codon:yes stop_codon:yes gene_type:complete
MLINDLDKKILNKILLEKESEINRILINYPEILQLITENKEDIIFIHDELNMKFTGYSDIKDASGRLDLIYVDSSATPILIESKLKKNPEINREVVGQLLEYKATSKILVNTEWDSNFFNEKISQNDTKLNLNNQEKLDRILKNQNITIEDFWDEFLYKFKKGFIKLVIASDEIPTRTKRVIEAENEESTYSEFLGLEINKYKDGKNTLFYPKLIGRTEKSKVVKKHSESGFSYDKFKNNLSHLGVDTAELMESLEKWQQNNKSNIYFDSGKINPVYYLNSVTTNKQVGFLYVMTRHKKFNYPFLDIRLSNFKKIEEKNNSFSINKFRKDLSPFLDEDKSTEYFIHIKFDKFDNSSIVSDFVKVLTKYSEII